MQACDTSLTEQLSLFRRRERVGTPGKTEGGRAEGGKRGGEKSRRQQLRDAYRLTEYGRTVQSIYATRTIN